MAGIGEVLKKPILSITHTFSPSVISESRIGYQHLRIYRIPQNQDLGTTSIIPGLPFQGIDGAPQITINNIVAMSEAGSRDLDQSISCQSERHDHTRRPYFKDRRHLFVRHPLEPRRSSPTARRVHVHGTIQRNRICRFRRWGYPATTQKPSPSSLATKGVGSRYEAYVQDTWKITHKLTATLGLRYDLQWLRPDAQNYGSLFIPNLGKVAVFADSMPAAAVPGALNAYPVVLSKSLNCLSATSIT